MTEQLVYVTFPNALPQHIIKHDNFPARTHARLAHRAHADLTISQNPPSFLLLVPISNDERTTFQILSLHFIVRRGEICMCLPYSTTSSRQVSSSFYQIRDRVDALMGCCNIQRCCGRQNPI